VYFLPEERVLKRGRGAKRGDRMVNVRIKGRREYVIKHGFLQQKLAGDSLPTLFVEVPGCSKSLSG
jgi:hypothetical protein